jgi:hypothetical protein
MKFWGWVAIILAITAILHWKTSQGQLESARQALLARQRAVVVELGPRWLPLRDKIEAWTLELAREPGAEIVDRDSLNGWEFRDKPGIYLRLRVDQASGADAVRKAAKQSLHDAFTSCLLRLANPNPLAGGECRRTHDCPTGQFCNEIDRCSRPAQPYNLRVAYRTMHILSDEWLRDAQETSTELRMRLLTASFDDTIRDDIPLAVDLLTRAQYFLLVLDEVKTLGAPPPDGGADPTDVAMAEPHFARVGLWRLQDGKLVLRARREAGGELLGGMPSADPEVLAARQRQANSCALALSLRQAMGDTSVSPAPAP